MYLCDVTIREGGQMPGRDYGVEPRVRAGRILDGLGLGLIQPGFAAVGDPDAGAIEALAARCDATIVSIARARVEDVDAAIDAGADVVEVLAPFSDLQLEHSVGMTRTRMLDQVTSAVDHAVERSAEVHLTLVDAFRAEHRDVLDAFERYVEPAIITIADTVGVATPRSVERTVRTLEEAGADPGRVGVHFHNDLGLATANTLTAARFGVGKADVSVGGIGERAGNCPLEELVVAAVLEEGTDFGVDRHRLIRDCHAVLDVLDEEVSPRKAILGEEVTTHESSIHVAAMLSEPATMEPFDPAGFGGQRRLVFGEHTGHQAAARLLERAGFEATTTRVERLRRDLAAAGPVDLEAALETARLVAEGSDI